MLAHTCKKEKLASVSFKGFSNPSQIQNNPEDASDNQFKSNFHQALEAGGGFQYG